MKRFYVKFHFGHFRVMDSETDKFIVGYSKKIHAQQTADGLNRIRKRENVDKMIEKLHTLDGYGHYTR